MKPREDPTYTPPPELLNVEQVRAILGVSRVTVFNLFKNNQLERLKIGRRTVVRRSEVDRFIASLDNKG